MPQAEDGLRERWGGQEGVGTEKAIAFLESHGFVLTSGFCWSHPTGKVRTPEECSAADFLIQEWDFGGFV